MIKAIVKLLIFVVLVNTLYQVASAYMAFYRFKDAVMDAALHSSGQTDDQIKDKVAELAAAHDQPLDAQTVAVRREQQHTYIDGSYTRLLSVLPGYQYPWPFSLSVDAFVINPVRLGDLPNPQ